MDTKAFKERFSKWKSGANYWKDIRGVNLDDPKQQENNYDEDEHVLEQANNYAEQLKGYRNGKDSIGTFVNNMGPTLYHELQKHNLPNTNKVYDYMMRQLAYESQYGTSNIAKQQHNYGGVGYNGKTYNRYKDDASFAKDYVNLMTNKYSKALQQSDVKGYAKVLKQGGYYQDDSSNYANNLSNMTTLGKRTQQHMQQDPSLYQYKVSLQDINDDDYDEAPAVSTYVQKPQPVQSIRQQSKPINLTRPTSYKLPNIIDTYNAMQNGDNPLQFGYR